MINHIFAKLSKALLVVFLFVFSLPLFALSLGEIHVKSHFAEPFLAEIELPSYTAEEMASIEIHLASNKQHESMGYAITQLSKSLRFSVEEGDDGKLYIEVRSEATVKELSLSILIEVTSVNGRIIKGYDILLTPKAISGISDLPELSIKVPEVSPKQTSTAETQNELRAENQEKNIDADNIATATEKKTGSLFRKIRRLEGGGFEYRDVASGESLSRIAQRIRPEKSMHMYQVMVALFKENPDAFLNNNINNLQLGSNLKLQNIDEITQLSASQAYQFIQKQSNADEPSSEKTESKTFFAASLSQQDSQSLIEKMQSELTLARSIANELKEQNTLLKSKISALEEEIKSTTQALFHPEELQPSQQMANQDSASANMIAPPIVNNLENNDNEPSHSNSDNLIFSGATLLALALVVAWKKDAIKILVNRKILKKEPNIFS